MRKIFIFFVSIVFITSYGFTLSLSTIKGRVSSDEGSPIADVKVEVIDTNISTQTKKDGTFVLKNLDQDRLYLVFSHPDYLTKSMEVSLEIETGQVVEVSLTPKNPILMTIKEEITVTAEADSIIDVNLPSHRTILPASMLTEIGTANITETVDKVPGVAAVGKGGYSMVPAIRGLAEHRVLLLVDGIRITSERRIGAGASFVNLGDIDRIEVNRGPYSVFYGSGAVGGIINIITKAPGPNAPLKGDFNLSYNTIRQERAGSAILSGSIGRWGWMLGANAKKADDYSSPSGIIEWSRYSDYDFMFKLNRESESSQFYTTVYHYQGIDIGKPSPTARLKPRWYPDERNTLLTLGYNCHDVGFLDNLNTSIYILASSMETQGDNLREGELTLKKRSLAEVENINFGFKLRGGKALSQKHTLNFGFDFFGQGGVNDQNIEWQYDEIGVITSQNEETSLQESRRSNFGFYLDDKIQISDKLTLNLGGRFDFINTSNLNLEGSRVSRSDDFLSVYMGSVFQATPSLSFLVNIGRSFRFPTISELFYTGLTGRGTVFGNPDLSPETSLNIDLGFRYLHEKFFFSIYGFSNSIADMIQKYGGGVEEEYFYRNLTSGRILGIEGEFYSSLMRNLEIFINFHHMKGEEKDTDAPLNYIPPTRLTLWGKYSLGSFWVEPRLTFSSAVEDPGPLEIAVDGYVLFDTILGYKVGKNFTLLAILQNLLDQTYRPSADEAGVDAPGRGIVFRAKYSF